MRLLLLLCWSLAAAATKPCAENPCRPAGAFDAKECENLATWVVVGRLESIEHHHAGAPLLKDFAEFVVRIEKWDKGKPVVERIRFHVGWCNNAVVPPDKVGARLRIYGSGDAKAAEPQYLWLEPIG